MVKPGLILRLGFAEIEFTLGESGRISQDRLLGKEIAGYHFQQVMGKGSFGTVYRAEQVTLGRQVAVKVLSDRHQKDPKQLQSFIEEARQAGRLNHHHLVQIHDVVQDEIATFLSMELMTGGAMTDYIRSEGSVDSEAVLDGAQRHWQGLSLCRVAKIDSIAMSSQTHLVNQEGVMLADLGTVLMERKAPLTNGEQPGSAHYVAWEQACGGESDTRATFMVPKAPVTASADGRTMFEGNCASHLSACPG